MEVVNIPCNYILSLLEDVPSDISNSSNSNTSKLSEVFSKDFRLRICFSEFIKAQILKETHPTFAATSDDKDGVRALKYLSGEIEDDTGVRVLLRLFNQRMTKLVTLFGGDNSLPFDIEIASPTEEFINPIRLRQFVEEQRYDISKYSTTSIEEFYRKVESIKNNSIATYSGS